LTEPNSVQTKINVEGNGSLPIKTGQITEDATIPELSLLGGPLQWLGCRLGLIRGDTNTLRLGVALGGSAWGVLILLQLMEGSVPRLISMAAIGVHVRFLLVIPLFFLCEAWVAPQMTEFARYIVRSGLVRGTALPALASTIRCVGRLKDSWLAEGFFLLAAFALPMIETIAPLPGTTGRWESILHSARGGFSAVIAWYLAFCLPLFRFLIFRWLWRLGLWTYFLWRVEQLNLNLIPTHSDGAAGLGYLEIVHEEFVPLALAISALLSAQFAEDFSSGTVAFANLYSLVPMVMALTAALFVGPLFIFARKLWICRWTGMSEYMGMASRYVTAFDNKWIRDENSSGESQLGTGDLQSLADLTNSVNVVRGMRPIPASKRLITELALSAVLPLLPLLLFKYPIDQLASRLFQALTGL